MDMTMKSSLYLTAACFAAALVPAGCNKVNPPPPVTAPVVVPPMPAPVVPKSAEAPSPLPGQANDHSSPAFKVGGKPNPPK